MSESSGPISPANLNTVAAVAAVLAVLSLAYSVYLHRELQVVAVSAAAYEGNAARRDADYKKQIDALTAKVATLEQVAAAAPPTPVADAAAPAEAPK